MSQVTSRMAAFDWSSAGSTFAGWVDGLSARAVKGMDFSGIDWAGFLTGKLLGPISTALTGAQVCAGRRQL